MAQRDEPADSAEPVTRSVGRARTTLEAAVAQGIEWTLLTGNRIVVALGIAALLGLFFASLGAAGALQLTNLQLLGNVYHGLTIGNITLITVIVSINQLLLARELKDPGDLQSQIEDVIEYRSEVEAATNEIAPVQPLGFLQLLVEATRQEAQRLGGYVYSGPESGSSSESTARAEIDEVVATLTEQMDQIDSLLTESETSTFGVLSAMLETNYALQINRLRQLRAEYEAELEDDVYESVDDLIDRLQEIDVARQYFKAIYLQEELSELSRGLLYAGLPAMAVTIATLLTLPDPLGGSLLSLDGYVPVAATIAVGLLPLSILGSFILRTATVTKLTAATLPFTTPEQERLFS